MRAILVSLVLFCASGPAIAADFVVTSTSDAGTGSLRQVILDANAAPGSDSISLALAPPGLHTIQPATELPAVAHRASEPPRSRAGSPGHDAKSLWVQTL